MKDDVYNFHQTPRDIAKKLLDTIPFKKGDHVIEPFKGEGAFYDQLPDFVTKDYGEIEEGIDFRDVDYSKADWVVSNVPFRLENKEKKRVNAFWKIIDFFTNLGTVGNIAFLGNDYCLCTLTVRRLKILEDRGWYINKITVCDIKKWRGRYFWIIFGKENNKFYSYLK